MITKSVADKFIEWIRLKIFIHHKSEKELEHIYFREKQIWWVHLGKNIGHEQDGKNRLFERPVIILRKYNKDFFLGVPTSTKIKPGNRFYHRFDYAEKEYSAILSQAKPISARRLIRKIGKLDINEFVNIQDRLVSLIKNDSRTNK